MADYKNISWDSFSIASSEFKEAIQDESLSRLLHEYFTGSTQPNSSFLKELAADYPMELVRSIRTSQAFFKQIHLESFRFMKSHPNTYLSGHYTVFSKIAELEQELFLPFTQSLAEIRTTDVMEVMSIVGFWFEKIRASLFDNGAAGAFQYDLTMEIEVINFFLTHYLFENRARFESLVLPEFADIEAFAKVVSKVDSYEKLFAHPVWQSLDTAFIYYYHLNGTFEIYSFDMNCDVVVSNGSVETKYIDRKKWEDWHRNEAKVAQWYNHYRILATELVMGEIAEKPNFIKNTTGFDFDMNFEGQIRQANAFLIAEDYCVDESVLCGVPNSALIQFLNGFVSNAYGRFVLPMDELNAKHPGNWLYHTIHIFGQFGLKELAAVPLRLCTKSEFKDLAIKNVSSSDKSAETLVNLLSTDISKVAYVNRRNPIVNLISKPFIKIGNYYLAFNGILGESNSQANLLINIMESNSKAHSKVERKETEQLEQLVKSMFEKAGFNNVDCTKCYCCDNTQGDFDILVYEDSVLLVIELKRSKIRTTLSDVHNEYENSLLKASKQLDKAMGYIKTQFDTFKANEGTKLHINEPNSRELKIYPFIVSTSFEYDHVLIRDKHLKISLFELQNILLRDIEQVSANKLESLIQYILSDKYWQPVVERAHIPNMEKWSLQFGKVS